MEYKASNVHSVMLGLPDEWIAFFVSDGSHESPHLMSGFHFMDMEYVWSHACLKMSLKMSIKGIVFDIIDLERI